MRVMNDGFVSIMDVGDEFRVRNVFCTDARSRVAYEYFGYAITFDMMYLTNRCGMPFAPFVGVNHHGQSILLGAGLIPSEDTTAIDIVWHIMRKLPEKFGSHVAYDTRLKTTIQSGLYNERSFWIPVYLKDVFWASMSTTRQSESMNAFCDGFVHSVMTLKEFVHQFDNALRKKVKVETTADFHSCNQMIRCVSSFKIEKQFQSLYTNAKFKEVQREVWGMIMCNPALVSTQGCISTFDVFKEISTSDEHVKIVKFSVYYNEDECEVKCTCALFEMRGIVYKHAFRVCWMKYIHELPEKYVLD
ncbi:protein FAR-RED ELONGATED HYPOCOTYL 3-like [Juglans microcarpa x Juglans regia]|uniref:protein FAR-RED ELONGATED HYPOCOTYL 3-like n=1 Tax=Juglans microcarpa x Juglans regia TaxID=2249226 RepID=UPI001B7DC6A1|nr:protein FAR-RED ELONGATED HYPOCOTYL 3-like [Juglans microcarpa x Juglans regia]